MADNIHLTEEEQVERIKNWWKQNALSILIGVGGGLAIVFGYQYWQQQKLSLAESASAEYQSIADNKTPNLEELAVTSNKFKIDYKNTPYAVKVALLTAKFSVENDELDAAAAELQWVIDNAPDTFTQHLARTRLANVLVEQDKLDAASALIAITEKDSFESSYYEIEGDIARLKRNFTVAKASYNKALEIVGTDPYSQVLQLKANKMNSLTSVEQTTKTPTEAQ